MFGALGKTSAWIPSRKGSTSSQVCGHVCELSRGQWSFPQTWVPCRGLPSLLPSRQAFEGGLCDPMSSFGQQMNLLVLYLP